MREETKKKKAPVLGLLFLTAVLVLAITTAGVTLAKYIFSQDSSGAAVAEPFYFSSDKLSSASVPPYFQVEEPESGGSVVFTLELRNYIDSLRRTQKDIAYSCTAQSAVGGSLGAPQTGTLAAGADRNQEITFTLPKSAFYRANGEMGIVTITAQATAPYEKTISCTLGFQESQSALQWSLSDEAGAVVLSLGGGAGESVTITWPSSLTPDLSNTLFSGSSAQSVTFPMESGARYALTFLKSDDTTYTKADFTVIGQ